MEFAQYCLFIGSPQWLKEGIRKVPRFYSHSYICWVYVWLKAVHAAQDTWWSEDSLCKFSLSSPPTLPPSLSPLPCNLGPDSGHEPGLQAHYSLHRLVGLPSTFEWFLQPLECRMSQIRDLPQLRKPLEEEQHVPSLLTRTSKTKVSQRRISIGV